MIATEYRSIVIFLKQFIVKFTLLFMCLFLTNCVGEKGQVNVSDLTLNKIQSVQLKQGEELFGKFFEQIKFTDNGNYWLFSERILNKVYVFDKSGNLYSIIGERGKGPKGLIQVTGFDVNQENEVVIYDSSQRLLKVFDLQGNLVYSTSVLENETYNPTANNINWYNNQVITSIYDTKTLFKTENSSLLTLIDENGDAKKIFGKFDPFSVEDNQLTFNSLIAIDQKKGWVYSNLQTSPYYQIHDISNGELISYEGEMTNSFKIPKNEISPYLSLAEKFKLSTGVSGVLHIFLTDKFFIQHLQILTEEWFETSDYTKKKNVLVFYDRTTNEFVKEIPVENTPIGIYNNKLFFVENFNPDNYEIGIYSIDLQ